MMPSDHIAVVAAAAFVLIRRDAKPLTCVAVALTSHMVLDAIPHAEPSMLGNVGFYLRPKTWEFGWVAADHVLAFLLGLWMCAKNIETLWDRRFPLMCFFAWAPDLIWVLHYLFDTDTLAIASYIHELPHLPWKWMLNLSEGTRAPALAWIIGLTTYIAFWFLPFKFIDWYETRAPKLRVMAQLHPP